MLILHANWSEGAFHLWGESFDAFRAIADRNGGAEHAANGQQARRGHPFAAAAEQLRGSLGSLQAAVDESELALIVPHRRGRPEPSERLANVLGVIDGDDDAAPELMPVRVPTVRIPADRVLSLLLKLESIAPAEVERGFSLRYWTEVARFVLALLADQRFVPSVVQSNADGLRGVWHPWLQDEAVHELVRALVDSMPAIVRATVDRHEGIPASILGEALTTLTDASVRRALIDDGYGETLDAIDAADDSHAYWLRGLLGEEDRIETPGHDGVVLFRDVSQWIGRLDESEDQRDYALVLRLEEPVELLLADHEQRSDGDEPPSESYVWRLSYHLAAGEGDGTLIDAADIWLRSGAGGAGQATRRPGAAHPEEVLLSELTRAGRMCEMIERSLNEQTPTGLDLSTSEAHAFLREHRPVLEEAGIQVRVPSWWDTPSSQIGARLQLDTPELEDGVVAAQQEDGAPSPGRAALGLQALVDYKWEISLGDQVLTKEEFDRLLREDSPLVRLRGRWVEFRPEDRQRAKALFGAQTSGRMTLLEAMRQVSGIAEKSHGLPITGLDATGWFGELLEATSDTAQRMTMLDQPSGFHGTLRPYQKAGLSWLAFLDRFGLGACLADDMGLGKTIQLIALLLHEREHRAKGEQREPDGALEPTLLIVPTSVVSNWHRELARFSPSLKVHVQHGPDRPTGAAFIRAARDADVVITTYALVSRDIETLSQRDWHRVVLDEAQYIKNPPTKQARAIRSLPATRRIALTGTPVENRLSELWSIMEFCNPGYLGPSSEFRREFALPIERHRDQERARVLRMMVRPFILRRLKSDPRVIDDLPPCVESKEYAVLTPEQAKLYEQCVRAMLNEVESSDGMQRRGLILATLVKLKQICNHPLQLAGSGNGNGAVGSHVEPESAAHQHGTLAQRSGKSRRLLELLEEVVASDEKALVFTQFRQMGHLLATMIRAELDCDVLFLHGGTPSAKRQQFIDRFQDPRGGAPVFVLSLKAGGLGLNLTAANHVFHFDRWWNPAVENQATDRAFRIGQTRTVQVHKFVCQGTLEERIDEMIEQKMELAENIIGSGEQWLTELSTSQLRDLLMLRQSAMEVEE